MTDSVRCTADSPHTFTCEVELDSDFEQLTCEAPEPAPAANPAVSLLVSKVVSRTLLPAPPAPVISGAALSTCVSSELSIVLAAAVTEVPIVGALTMLKAVLDAGSCLTVAHDEAAQRNAEDYCAAQGGRVLGVERDKTICEVRETRK